MRMLLEALEARESCMLPALEDSEGRGQRLLPLTFVCPHVQQRRRFWRRATQQLPLQPTGFEDTRACGALQGVASYVRQMPESDRS